MRGIGLLPVDTVFAEHKTRTQVCGKFLELDEEFAPLKNVEFTGYEIHMGESTWKNGAVASTSTCDRSAKQYIWLLSACEERITTTRSVFTS